MFQKIIKSNNSKTIIIVRLMVGVVFLVEGIQKFIYPDTRGPGRFEKMGFPDPEILGNLVGFLEVTAGILILLGLFIRGAAVITLVIMSVAIITTKIPIGLGESFGPFVLRDLKTYGFWSMAHEMRTDFAMWLGSLFLLIEGGGKWSADLRIWKNLKGGR